MYFDISWAAIISQVFFSWYIYKLNLFKVYKEKVENTIKKKKKKETVLELPRLKKYKINWTT